MTPFAELGPLSLFSEATDLFKEIIQINIKIIHFQMQFYFYYKNMNMTTLGIKLYYL